MNTDLFTYSGTGNSLWIARELAKEIGDGRTIAISRIPPGRIESGADRIGIIFPVHIWGLPRRVISFVDSLVNDPSRYYFAVAVNAGQVAATLLQLRRLMAAKGLSLSLGFSIAMPSNYIPWGGPGPKEKQNERYERARKRLAVIAAAVSRRECGPVERGPLWQNILLTAFNRLSFPRVPAMDRSFWVDAKCNGCGICTTVCPCGNVELSGGTPRWCHRCEQCLACLQWCPQEAIQFGKKTPQYERYRHPEVELQDMIVRPAVPASPDRRSRSPL